MTGAEIDKITRKLGPNWTSCLKCGPTTAFPTSVAPVFMMQTTGSEPGAGPKSSEVHSKTCNECGFVELYCPDAIRGD